MNAVHPDAESSTVMAADNGNLLHLASWNINGQAGYTVPTHLHLLQSLGCGIVALQEVKEDYFDVLRQHPSVSDIAFSLDLRPPSPSTPPKHRLGCAVMTLDPSLRIRKALVIDTTVCPERTLVAEIIADRKRLQVASLHCPNGSNWGRQKAVWFRDVAAWMRAQTKPTAFGIDANTPKSEGLSDTSPDKWWREDSHPAVGNGAQQLVGDTPQHKLRDAWKRLNPNAVKFPVSFNRDKKFERRPEFACRYDFLFISPHFTPVTCEYHYDAVVKAVPRLSDHAMVTASVML